MLCSGVLLGEEIARTALFLAADDSRMITKQSFIVDAGHPLMRESASNPYGLT